jgi:hypothetical protein
MAPNERSRKGSGSAPRSASRRKLIELDPETWHALQLLGRDSMKTLQELADEAFADLLRKHNRPVTLREALRASARRLPANDDPAQRKGRRS